MPAPARASAPTQLEQVLVQLREGIMRGRFEPDARLEEKRLAQELGVSRTPVRLALQALAQEGLLLYRPHRGFVVRVFSAREVIEAIDVRGRLEAYACELLAAQGIEEEVARQLADNLAQTRALLDQSHRGLADVTTWAQLNEAFHRLIVNASGNVLIAELIEQIRKVPMASAGVIPSTTDNVDEVFDYVRSALRMHELVYEAVLNGQPSRAYHLMLEHVYQGRVSILAAMEAWSRGPQGPGLQAWRRVSSAATSRGGSR